MSHPIARFVPGSPLHDTINVRTVKVFFQSSPGRPGSGARGIPDLECRILHDGLPVRLLRSAKNGLVDVPLLDNRATLEILHQGAPVAVYELVADDRPFDPIGTVIGQQQRLRHLGYQLGHGGPDEDGIGAPIILNVTPIPRPPRDPEEDDEDRELRKRRRAEQKANPDEQESLFLEFTFETERSVLDFQADAGLFVDARVGPQTRGKLVAAAGE